MHLDLQYTHPLKKEHLSRRQYNHGNIHPYKGLGSPGPSEAGTACTAAQEVQGMKGLIRFTVVRELLLRTGRRGTGIKEMNTLPRQYLFYAGVCSQRHRLPRVLSPRS
jgi:hypothetical protein